MKVRQLKTEGIPNPTKHTWRAHNTTPQQFPGFFIADIHYKIQPEVLQVRFCVFKDTTGPKILLSYTTKVMHCKNSKSPVKSSLTALDTITSSSKHVSFSMPIQTNKPVKPSNNWKTLKPAIMKHTL